MLNSTNRIGKMRNLKLTIEFRIIVLKRDEERRADDSG